MTSVSTLTILAPDLSAARKFYCDVLGFAVAADYGPELTKLQNDGCALLLARCEQAARPNYPGTAQIALGLAVADISAESERLKAAGVELIFAEPQDFPAGRFIAVRDPAGNVVELLQFIP